MQRILSDRSTQNRIVQYGLVVGFILVLELFSRSGMIPPIILVPPTTIFDVLVELLLAGEILGDLWLTGISALSAFAGGALLGIPAGWILWRWDVLLDVLDPYLVVFYAFPVFAFYPIFVAIFGLGRLPITLVAFLMSWIVIVINASAGFGMIKEVHRMLGRSLNLTRYQQFRYVLFPAAVPYIFTGLKLGFVYALVGTIASEFILSNAGLGYVVSFHYDHFNTAEMYAGIALVVVLAVLINAVLNRVENVLYARRSGV